MPGIPPSRFRAVGVLRGDQQLNTDAGLNGLSQTDKDDLRSRIEWWIAGHNGPKQWFHGFTGQAQYKQCFVFKVRKHRFYGYLYHPQTKSNQRFQVCVLSIYAIKHAWETDYAELDRVNRWMANAATKHAIAMIYPEKEQSQWKN